MSEKKTGLNFPPLHPHCRCTIVARFAWEDDGDDEPTPTPTPTKPEKEPGYFERSPIQMSDSELKAVNNWLTNVETVSKPAADAVHENPTKANTQAAADAQDAAMKAEEQRQQAAIGAQRRAIQQGKSTEILNKKKTRSADSDRGMQNADRIARSEGNMRETAQQIKREYQRKDNNFRALIRDENDDVDDMLNQVYQNINIGDESPLLEATAKEFEKRNNLDEKVQLIDNMLEDITEVKSNWNGQIGEITEEMQSSYKQLLVGAYAPETRELAFRGTPTMSTIIHELMHTRSTVNQNAINNSTERQRLIEENIEDGLCEFITMCIFKKMGKPIPEDISYEPLVTKVYQIYKRLENMDALQFAMELFKTPRGLRFEKIKTILNNLKQDTLTSEEIKGIIQNAGEVFAIPREEL